jgi:hypothetical protein
MRGNVAMALFFLALATFYMTNVEHVSYSGEVARIIQAKCQECHHPGTAAPFSLMTYKDAVKWADNIKEAVVEKRMPPWFADPQFGKFRNDRRLSEIELRTLLTWIESNRDLGDPTKLPPERAYADGWTIGKPDLILELPVEQDIPASGVIPYRLIHVLSRLKQDVWLQAAEVRPGNRAAVHHVNISIVGKNGEFLLGGVPGDWSWTLPPGQGRRLPAGADLLWEIHYVPTGTPAKDRSQLGLIFYKGKEPPKCTIQTIGLTNDAIRIPPYEPNYQAEIEWPIKQSTMLVACNPHMHFRGKDFDYKVIYPDGSCQTLLSVPKYDFNWQLNYKLQEPLLLPAGSKLHCTAHYDNSPGNPANPDPTQEVGWSDDSTQEMMIAFVDVLNDAKYPYEFALTLAKDTHRRRFVNVPFGIPDRIPPAPEAQSTIVFRAIASYVREYWHLSLAVPVAILLTFLLRKTNPLAV